MAVKAVGLEDRPHMLLIRDFSLDLDRFDSCTAKCQNERSSSKDRDRTTNGLPVLRRCAAHLRRGMTGVRFSGRTTGRAWILNNGEAWTPQRLPLRPTHPSRSDSNNRIRA